MSAAPGQSAMDEIDLRVEPGWDEALGGDAEDFARQVLRTAMEREGGPAGVAVWLAGDEDLRALNAHWRGKDEATNVLSFPAPPGAGYKGDVALALGTVSQEARAQAKPFPAHAAHLLVHGYLHLLGYDHDHEEDAERMEARERAILAALSWPDPYG